MSDIQPGDLVVCVDADQRPKGSVRQMSPEQLQAIVSFLVDGRCYRVTDAIHHLGIVVLRLSGEPIPATVWGGYNASRFRKLNDEPDNAELIAQIKSCRPMKTRIPA